jgi:hypothetical protein
MVIAAVSSGDFRRQLSNAKLFLPKIANRKL